MPLQDVQWRINLLSRSEVAGFTYFTYQVNCSEFTDLSHWGLLVSESETFTVDTITSTDGWQNTSAADPSSGSVYILKFNKQINCPALTLGIPGVPIVLVLPGTWNECAGEYLVKGSNEYAIGSVPVPCQDQTLSGEGDPHLQNIHGEFFDVWKLGKIDLLRLPKSRAHPAHLFVQGTISKVRFADGHVDDDCDGPVITAVHVSGNWLGNQKSVNVSLDINNTALKTHQNHPYSKLVVFNTKDDRKLKFTVQDVELTVEAKGRYDRQYLRFVAEHVTTFHGEVGGLLGSDDHSDESLRPDVCGEAPKHNRIGMFRSPDDLMALAS